MESINENLKKITHNHVIRILSQNKFKLLQISNSIHKIIKILLFFSDDKNVKNLFINYETNKDSINLMTDNYFKFFKKHLWQIHHDLLELNQ